MIRVYRCNGFCRSCIRGQGLRWASGCCFPEDLFHTCSCEYHMGERTAVADAIWLVLWLLWVAR
jgi:hypothetical protein